VELAEDMLFVELAKAGDDWLWHSAKGRIENIGNKVGPIALCDLLLWMMIVAEVGSILAPSFSWTKGIPGSLSWGDWYHYCGTYSTEA
jgi:hypothetical protein